MGDRRIAERLLLITLGLCLSIVCPSSSSDFEVWNKYVSTSYFQIFESLHDSAFQHYIENATASRACRPRPMPYPRISNLRRQLTGQGYHRHVSSVMEVVGIPQSCEFVMIEKLPAGVFSDFFELQRQTQRSDLTDMTVMGDTNVELPAFLSNRTLVEIHVESSFRPISEKVEFNINFPVHARYPPLDDSGYHEVRFGVPDILLQCLSEFSEREGMGSCLLRLDVELAAVKYSEISWTIPSGRKTHESIVSVITIVVAFTVTTIIVLMSFSPFSYAE